jgi:hypothetical protein
MRIICLLLALFVSEYVVAQLTISSNVVNVNGDVLPGATVVVLNALDSTLITGTITDDKGEFRINLKDNTNGVLYFSYVGFISKRINLKDWNNIPVTLVKSKNNIGEVSVTGIRNRVIVKENRIVFNTQGINESRAATNAFELFDYVPGLLVQNNQVAVVGASRLTVVINNKITNMSMDQVLNFLKATPSDQVKNIEYYFVAPRRFNVDGALINVQLKQGIEKGKYNGSLSGNYLRGRENFYDGNLNLSLNHKKWDIQAIITQETARKEDKNTITTYLNNSAEDQLTQFININSDKDKPLYSLNPRYTVNDSAYIDFTYSFLPQSGTTLTSSRVISNFEDLSSENTSKGESDYHNFALNCLFGKTNAGLTYSDYQDPTGQNIITNDLLTNEESIFLSESEQDIRQFNAFVNRSAVLKKGKASVDYGLSYDNIYNESSNNERDDDVLSLAQYKLEENRANAFVSLSYQISPKISSVFALELEYDKLEFKDVVQQTKVDVVDDYFLFPTLDLTYVISPNHIIKANFSSFSEYPDFWSLTPNTWTLTPYANVQGNPSLKPQKNYNSQLIYIFKGKYIFVLGADLSKDWITQVPFNGDDQYSITYKSINIDKYFAGNMAVVLPFSPVKKISSKFTASLSYDYQKDNLHEDYSIDKSKVSCYFGLNNSITLSKKREVFADLNGYYVSARPQGFYDLNDSFKIDFVMRMKVLSNASLKLSCTDIFNSKTPNATTDFENQHNHFNFDFDTRRFKIGFVYNFGEKIKMRKKSSDLAPSERFKRN